jgi:hypothetical protein
MKLLTYLLYTLLIATFFSCGHPQKKKKWKMKKHKMEMRMKNDTIHTDSARQERMRMCCGEKRKHKRDSIN